MKVRVHAFKLFIFSILAGLKINFVGQLAASDIVMAFDVFSRPQVTLNCLTKFHFQRKIIFAFVFFLLIQIVSDILNGTSGINMARGVANIIMAIIVLCFYSKYFANSSFILAFFWGIAIRNILFKNENAADSFSLEEMSFVKIRLVPILNAMLFCGSALLLQKGKSLSFLLYIYILYALFCLAFDSRSNGVFIVITFFIIFFRRRISKISSRNIFIYVIGLCVFFQMFYSIYVDQVLSGNLGGGHSVEQLKRISNPYNPLSLIITGRAEFVAGLSAVSDKPWFGHGSWAEDKSGKYLYIISQLHDDENLFMERFKFMKPAELIVPSHSVLIGAWVSAGVFGFIAIFYIFALYLKMLLYLIRNREFQQSKLYPLVVFYGVSAIWTFLFSPLNDIKGNLPIYISMVSLIYTRYIKMQ